MTDLSHLDKKHFIDGHVHNCPHCNRRHVPYKIESFFKFNWNNQKDCYVYQVECESCEKLSMHLSYEYINYYGSFRYINEPIDDIDSKIFYSVPSSFFIIDERIPRILRELITEADGSLKMNFLTGASACLRKTIYELLIIEKAQGEDYQSRIKFLKSKYKDLDPTYFDILSHIQDMTSDKVHEQSWDKWDSPTLRLLIETLKSIFQEMYVIPAEKKERADKILQIRQQINISKKPKES